MFYNYFFKTQLTTYNKKTIYDKIIKIIYFITTFYEHISFKI